jgi:hypothetical protein
MKTESQSSVGKLFTRPPVYEAVNIGSEHTPKVPIALDITERAVALAGIMEYLNKANQTAGSRKVQEVGGGRFRRSYGAASSEVQRGAERNRDMLLGKFRDGLRTLSATGALETNGYDEDTVEEERMRMQMAINQEFGVGKANAVKRNTVTKKAVKSAEIITGQKIEL